MWNCSVPQREHKEWGEFWRPGYHVCLDCCEAGAEGFPDRLRKHAEALEERAAELRKLINAKWQVIELDDAAARDNDPIFGRTVRTFFSTDISRTATGGTVKSIKKRIQ